MLKVAPPPQAADRICTGIAGFTRTHNLRPAEITTDKKRTGILRALPLSYSGVFAHGQNWSRRRDSNPRQRAEEAIIQSCDPSKMAKDGQEAASMFLDGNRTRIFSFSRAALTQLSYPVR